MNRIIDFFKDKPASKILDIGTGGGNFIALLQEVFPESQITGIDPNSDSLKEAKKLYPKVTFKQMGAEKLEFDDNSFDVATISMALHHLADINKSLSEIRRVVKMGGWIIITELFSDKLNPAQKVHKMYHHFGSRIDRIFGVSHNKAFRKNEILKIVEDFGIDIQLYFEFDKKETATLTSEEIEQRVEKMKQKLESIKEYPEYEVLKPQIEKFRNKVTKFGFQSATRVVIVGKFD